MAIAALMFLASGGYGLFVLIKYKNKETKAYIFPCLDVLIALALGVLQFIIELNFLMELALMVIVLVYIVNRTRGLSCLMQTSSRKQKISNSTRKKG